MAARESGRIKDAYQKRVLDEAARKRRQKKALEALEQDNFHDDPHADLGIKYFQAENIKYFLQLYSFINLNNIFLIFYKYYNSFSNE